MRWIFYIPLIFFAFCNKEKKSPVPEETESPAGIDYVNYEPDLVLNSVSGSTYMVGQGTVYTPVDTTCSVTATDISANSPWLRVDAKNYFNLVSPSTPASNYFHELRLTMLMSGDSLPFLRSNPGCAVLLNQSDAVSSNSEYIWGTSLVLRARLLIACDLPQGEKYIPFKRIKTDGVHYGWILVEGFGINGIKIKSAALNREPGTSIRCGQIN